MQLSPKGFKRSLMALMILAVPIVSAQPISMWQESHYTPQGIQAVKIPPVVNLLSRTKKAAPKKKKQPVYRGTASWYSETDPGINYRTANNEVFDDSGLTCASWNFPFGTYLKVVNEANGKSVVCRVNDRGPARRLNRLIDLTKGAFQRIAPVRKGLIRVSVTVAGPKNPAR